MFNQKKARGEEIAQILVRDRPTIDEEARVVTKNEQEGMEKEKPVYCTNVSTVAPAAANGDPAMGVSPPVESMVKAKMPAALEA